MNGEEIIVALDLPAAARVNRRVPKTLLVEHGAPTATEKRRINEGIKQIQWVATLKPVTIGVAAYRDDTREYLEIAVLDVTLRDGVKAARLIELLHRAVPYPVLAVIEQGDCANMSLAHKRWSLSETRVTVLDGELVAIDAPRNGDPYTPALATALALNRQPQSSLLTLYQGWIDVLLTLEAARRTGIFGVPTTTERRVVRREALRECERLEAEIDRLRAGAVREKQVARRVELNMELKRAEAARAAALAKL